MKIFVKAKPNSKTEMVEEVDSTHFVVKVKVPPTGGKANAAVHKALAAYFGIAPSRAWIVSGHASRTKVVEVL